ncbi:MAG: prepilin peptidase [Rhizobiales bacterium]|nr:prepilin peptidase [Hyphomicrobiales bacterium]
MSDLFSIFIKFFFPTMMVGVIIYDFFTLTIPNTLNFLIFIGFIFIAFMTGISLVDFGWHMLACFVALTFGFTLFAFNMFGGGDAKSLAASVTWFGWQPQTVELLLATAILGGVFAVFLLIMRSQLVQYLLPIKLTNIQWVRAIFTPQARMPYGVAIGAAGIWLYSPDKWLALIQ